MGERSGLGLIDLALLSTIERQGSLPNQPHTKCATVISSLDQEVGLAPAYAYLALCDLAKPWIVNPTLVDFHGDLGTRDKPSAVMRMTECRLSWLGALAVAAERGEIAPVPLGLIFGNTHLLGHHPPFDALGVANAVRLILEDPLVAAADVVAAIGRPVFPTGSYATGDLDTLIAGEWAKFTVSAHFNMDQATGALTIEHLPPDCSPDRLAKILLGRYRPSWSADECDLNRSEVEISSLLASVEDQSSSSGDRVVCTLATGVSFEQVSQQLVKVREMAAEVDLKLPQPLPDVVSDWVGRWGDEDLATSLDLLTAAIDWTRSAGPA